MITIIKSECFPNEKKRVVTTKITTQNGKVYFGQAWCSAEDTFNAEFGSKLSYLRAKRRMWRDYNKDNKRWYEGQMKAFAEWKKAQEDEIEKCDFIIGKIEEAIDTMLDNQE